MATDEQITDHQADSPAISPLESWALDGASIGFSLSEHRDAFNNKYAWLLDDSVPFESVMGLVDEIGATHVHVESYIDADYRNEYAHFYVDTFQPPSAWCERLHFWKVDHYLGYCTLRPIPGRPIGRTMLAPSGALQSSISCVSTGKPRPFGHPGLSVEAFPYISQDLQYGTCAHAVIWMIAYYHHLKNRCPRPYLSDIVEAVKTHEEERLMPSPGLSRQQVGVAFRQLGLPVVRYDGRAPIPGETGQSLVTRYVNSRIPLALGTSSHGIEPGHMSVIIGAGFDKDTREFYVIRADDQRGPYVRDDWAAIDDKWDRISLLVPLPERIYLSGEMAQRFANLDFTRLLTTEPSLSEVATQILTRNLRIRTYVIHSRAYREALPSRGLPVEHARPRIDARLPRWVWVAELQDRDLALESKTCVVGELVIDATSDAGRPRVLFAAIGDQRVTFPGYPTSAQPKLESPITTDVTEYGTGTALGL